MSERWYAIGRLLINNLTLVAVLALTASNFDYTEIRTIITVFAASSTVEAVQMSRKERKHES